MPILLDHGLDEPPPLCECEEPNYDSDDDDGVGGQTDDGQDTTALLEGGGMKDNNLLEKKLNSGTTSGMVEEANFYKVCRSFYAVWNAVPLEVPIEIFGTLFRLKWMECLIFLC
jgi:hypothetical protein